MGVTPETVQAGSRYIATWRCGKACEGCGTAHAWQARVQSQACMGRNCLLCSRTQVCPCQLLAEKQKDGVMAEWDWEGNGRLDPPLDPWSLGLGSRKRALWKCPEHGSWSTCAYRRTGRHATGCPTCANEAKRGCRTQRGLLKDECPEVFAQLHPTLNGGGPAVCRAPRIWQQQEALVAAHCEPRQASWLAV